MMGADIYFMEKRQEDFKLLCHTYLPIQGFFQSIICDRAWHDCDKLPQDSRPIFIKESDLSPYDNNSLIELIVLGFRSNKGWHAFTQNDNIDLTWAIGRKWQYVDDLVGD